jgi:hypothetical protein
MPIVHFLLHLAFKGALYHVGVRGLAGPNNTRAQRATADRCFAWAFSFTALWWACGWLMLLPGIGLLAWAGYAALFFYTFAVYLGLGVMGAMAIAVVQFIGTWLFRAMLGIG